MVTLIIDTVIKLFFSKLLLIIYYYVLTNNYCSIVTVGLGTRPIACRDSAGPATCFIACVADVQRGGRGKLNASAKRDRWALVGNACHGAVVFFVFYVHQRDAKILIGQN